MIAAGARPHNAELYPASRVLLRIAAKALGGYSIDMPLQPWPSCGDERVVEETTASLR